MTQHTRALLAEACGTFWFFFIGAGAVLTDAAFNGGGLLTIALAHGIALAIAISTFGVVSGGHFNPAVTFALAVAGRHPWARVPTYWAAQLFGGVLAGLALRYVFDFAIAAVDKTHLGTPGLAGTITPTVGIVIEALLTVFLVWAVYGTAVSPIAPRIAGFGIVPAGFYDNWYVYWIGPLIGAAIGGLSIRLLFAPPELERPAI